MASIEYDMAEFYGFRPENYLREYCRRLGVKEADYFVVQQQDQTTGRIRYDIHKAEPRAGDALDDQSASVNGA